MGLHGSKQRLVWMVLFLGVFLTVTSRAGAAVLPVPAGLTSVAGNGEVTLLWNVVAGAESYVLYRGETSGGPYSFVAQTRGFGYSDRGLANGVPRYYVVTSVNADGESPYSAPVAVTPTNMVLPAPLHLTALPGNGQVSLAWDAVTSAVAYNVYRAGSPGGPYTLLTPSAPGPGFTDTGLENGKTYYYVVQSLSSNAGAYSNEVGVTTSALLLPAPENLAAAPGSTWASLAWSPCVGATGYGVYRGTAPGGPYIFAALARTTTYEDMSGLANGTTYYYVVAALNGAGQGAFSGPASAAVAADQKPHASVLRGFTHSSGQIELQYTYTPAAGATSYALMRSPTHNGPYGQITVPTGWTYTDPNLTNGTTYYYVIDTHNASANVARSNEVAIAPTTQLPAPGNVAVIAGNGQATVTFNPVDNVGSYWVVVRQQDTQQQVASGGTGNGSFTATGLVNGTAYDFQVYAQSGGTTTSLSSVVVSATPADALPLAPDNVSTVANGNTQVSLQWTPVPGATGYYVYRKTGDSPWSTTPVASVAVPYCTDSGLTNGTRYEYKIAAFNAAGPGAWSPYTPAGLPTAAAFPAPTGVAVLPGNTELTATWNPVAGVTGYWITVNTPDGKQVASASAGEGPAVTIGGLTNGVAYDVRVYAMRGGLGSAYSDAVRVTPSVALPLAPLSAQLAAGGNTQLSIGWTPVDGATGYLIYRRTPYTPWSASPLAAIAGTLFTDTELVNGVSYHYRVAAINANGAGAWSSYEVVSSASPTRPLSPSLKSVTPGDSAATLTWNQVVGATGYYITVSLYPGGPNISGGNAGQSTSYTATGLTNGTTYYFRVQAVGGDTSAFSNEVSAVPVQTANSGNITGRVSVNVAGHSDLGVANATVALEGTNYTTSTDVNGNFTLSNIPFADYQLVISAAGMAPIQKSISVTSPALPLTLPQMAVSQVTGVAGDANGDGRLNMGDVVYVLQVLTGAR